MQKFQNIINIVVWNQYRNQYKSEKANLFIVTSTQSHWLVQISLQIDVTNSVHFPVRIFWATLRFVKHESLIERAFYASVVCAWDIKISY